MLKVVQIGCSNIGLKRAPAKHFGCILNQGLLLPELCSERDWRVFGCSKRGVSIVLVEQNADLALEIAQHGYVLETGNITLQGEAAGLASNEHVRKAYLGS